MCAHGCLATRVFAFSMYTESQQQLLCFPASEKPQTSSSQPARSPQHYIHCFKIHLSNSWHACSFSIMYVHCTMRDVVMFLPLREVAEQAVNKILTNYHHVQFGDVLVMSFSSSFAHPGNAVILAHFNMRFLFLCNSWTSSIICHMYSVVAAQFLVTTQKKCVFSWTDSTHTEGSYYNS